MKRKRERTREEREEHMVQLAKRVSTVLEGEELLDVASVCALCAAYAITELFKPSGRLLALEKLVEYMRERVLQGHPDD